MYKLIKILNAGINVPEPVRITLDSAVTVSRGMPVIISGGALTVLSDKATSLPTHVTLAPVDGKEVLCFAVTPDMVFETTASAAPTAMKVGNEYLLSADGSAVSATAVSGSLRGAVLMNKNGASAAGDSLLISFR